MADTQASSGAKSLEDRVTALEGAVESLGSPHVTQRHDGMKKFLDWMSGRGLKQRAAKAEKDPPLVTGHPPKAT